MVRAILALCELVAISALLAAIATFHILVNSTLPF
jgi:hypothetical protein